MAVIHREGFSPVSQDRSSAFLAASGEAVLCLYTGLGVILAGLEDKVRRPPGKMPRRAARVLEFSDLARINSLEAAPSSDFWPEQMLSDDLPDANILVYGYNADVSAGLFQGNNKNSIMKHARDLKVRFYREELLQTGSVIFIAHSLGGLILKDRTKLIIFIGTPHRGSQYASCGEIASRIATLGLLDTNRKILKDLKVYSDVLDRIKTDFVDKVYQMKTKIHSFYESSGYSSIKGLSNKVVPDTSAKVDLPQSLETVESLPGNHQTMIKYSSKLDMGYRSILAVLRNNMAHNFVNATIGKIQGIQPKTQKILLRDAATIPTIAQPFYNLPVDSSDCFVGRLTILRDINNAIQDANGKHYLALDGLGGIGKSTVALRIAREVNKELHYKVLWMHAGSWSRFEEDAAMLARKLCLPGATEAKVNKPALLRDWFESSQAEKWLLVLDNVDGWDVMFGKPTKELDTKDQPTQYISSYIPKVTSGHVLMTTWNHKIAVRFAGSQNTFHLDELEPNASCELLQQQIGGNYLVDSATQDLAAALHNIPLALAQAASFMSVNSMSAREYLDLYSRGDDQKLRLLSGEGAYELSTPIAKTWLISFRTIEHDDALAIDILSSMSMWDSCDIPTTLLPLKDDEIGLQESLGTLKAYYLISFKTSTKSYRKFKSWVEFDIALIARTFSAALDEDERHGQAWQRYIPHAISVTESAASLHYEATESELMQFYQHSGSYYQATTLLEEAIKIQRARKGVTNIIQLPATSRSQADHGVLQEAQKLNEEAVETKKKILGPDDPRTLTSISSQGLILQTQGHHAAAADVHNQVFESRRAILGLAHPDTLMSMSNRAVSLRSLGQFKEAEALQRMVLRERTQLFGENDPLTLTSKSNFAYVLQSNSQFAEAEALHRETLLSRQHILSKSHPQTLMSMHSLSECLRQQDKDPKQTLESIQCLGRALCQGGMPEEGRQHIEGALSGLQQALGLSHPKVMLCVDALAQCCEECGDGVAAKLSYEQALAGYEATLGKTHVTYVACHRRYVELLKRAPDVALVMER
ncbi:hypothetical protein VE03_07332 [Pseudogymnoascus sp. 23342-1-I1]|nr:hypothetical protein VE03_07332 [Pseudogymnoascus sp. 23342-1-I1]